MWNCKSSVLAIKKLQVEWKVNPRLWQHVPEFPKLPTNIWSDNLAGQKKKKSVSHCWPRSKAKHLWQARAGWMSQNVERPLNTEAHSLCASMRIRSGRSSGVFHEFSMRSERHAATTFTAMGMHFVNISVQWVAPCYISRETAQLLQAFGRPGWDADYHKSHYWQLHVHRKRTKTAMKITEQESMSIESHFIE